MYFHSLNKTLYLNFLKQNTRYRTCINAIPIRQLHSHQAQSAADSCCWIGWIPRCFYNDQAGNSINIFSSTSFLNPFWDGFWTSPCSFWIENNPSGAYVKHQQGNSYICEIERLKIQLSSIFNSFKSDYCETYHIGIKGIDHETMSCQIVKGSNPFKSSWFSFVSIPVKWAPKCNWKDFWW